MIAGIRSSLRNFNSLPHTEVDGKSACNGHSLLLYFNSLPHTEVDVFYTIIKLNSIVFQLTTSHRGRHGEKFYTMQVSAISTHYLTQR